MQKFNYHQHTFRCGHADLDMLDEDYILDYIKMGFKKIAFTDHCPQRNEIDKRTNIRMNYSQRSEYLNSIKELQEKYKDKIQIETGYEVEYLPGEEEYLRELKAETDKIILGQHFIYDDHNQLKRFRKEHPYTDSELIQYAEYIDKAMELGIPDIIAHPDFFMRPDGKQFGKIEAKISHMICESSEKYSIPLEINLNNIFNKVYYENKKLAFLPREQQFEKLKNVTYPCKDFWKIATQYKIKVLYGIDVHHKGQITLFHELVQFANILLSEEIVGKLNFIEDFN